MLQGRVWKVGANYGTCYAARVCELQIRMCARGKVYAVCAVRLGCGAAGIEAMSRRCDGSTAHAQGGTGRRVLENLKEFLATLGVDGQPI